jgi:hypothetical protein
MDKKNFLSLIEKTENPSRVSVGALNEKTYIIMSTENTNDTWGWFHINSEMLEEAFIEMNLSWCYVFETAPKQLPCIYLYVGEGLTKDDVINDNRIAVETLPEGREIFFEKKQFSLIDTDKYNNSMTVLEKELRKVAGNVFEVYEA